MNYMKQVAEMLGVELNEEFKIDGHEGNFRLSENFGLVHEHRVSMPSLLEKILTGRHKIIKMPWKPKCGDLYKHVNANGDICASVWSNAVFDVAMFLVGNCYRTDAEAEAHKPEMLAKMREVMGE